MSRRRQGVNLSGNMREEQEMRLAGPGFVAEAIPWQDLDLGALAYPKASMQLTFGLGSSLAMRPGDPPNRLWGLGDRGPNLKIETAIERYGLAHLEPLRALDGAKVIFRPDFGPTLAELDYSPAGLRLCRRLPLRGRSGKPISGNPIPGRHGAEIEPAFDPAGNPIAPDPSGADTEGLVALRDGGFLIADEYAPSLLRVDADGMVRERLVPEGMEALLAAADYPVHGRLPAIAARRRLNRGFEALAMSADEQWLYLLFQSPLAHPDDAAFARSSHVRLWQLAAADGRVTAQYLYPLDPPDSFRRDVAAAKPARRDVKVSEAVAVGADRLLVLERISHTTKLYLVDLDPACRLPPRHLEEATRPSLEEMDATMLLQAGIPRLAKTLLFSSDEAPAIDRDLEGMLLLSPTELLLVNDNDFGVEGAPTRFWRLRFDRPIG